MAGGFTHESTRNDSIEWYTPPAIFEALGLTFDLDPCHPAERLPWLPARNVYTEAENGLVQTWVGSCFVNPPYGPCTPAWMAKLAAHGNGIALVFARTDPEWFHQHAGTADAWCFIKGRLRFVGPDGKPKPGKNGKVSSAGAGSMLLAWGAENVAALERAGLGIVSTRRGSWPAMRRRGWGLLAAVRACALLGVLADVAAVMLALNGARCR